MDDKINNSDSFYSFNGTTIEEQLNALNDYIKTGIVNNFSLYHDTEPISINSSTIEYIKLDDCKLKNNYLYLKELSPLEFKSLRKQILYTTQTELTLLSPICIEETVSTDFDDHCYKSFIMSSNHHYLLSSDEDAWVMGAFSVLVRLYIFLKGTHLFANIYICSVAPTDKDTEEDVIKKNNAETLLKNEFFKSKLESSIVDSIGYIPPTYINTNNYIDNFRKEIDEIESNYYIPRPILDWSTLADSSLSLSHYSNSINDITSVSSASTDTI